MTTDKDKNEDEAYGWRLIWGVVRIAGLVFLCYFFRTQIFDFISSCFRALR